MNELILIRHGETNANHDNIVQGRIDNPLNDYGRLQARLSGVYLLTHGLVFDAVYSSPLSRARETATIIVSTMGLALDVVDDESLLERNFGDFDGKKIDGKYLELVRGNQIPNMEKHEDLEQRVRRGLVDICERNRDKRILIVAHSHVMKSVLVNLMSGFTYTSFLPNCAIVRLVYDNNGFTVSGSIVDPLQTQDRPQ